MSAEPGYHRRGEIIGPKIYNLLSQLSPSTYSETTPIIEYWIEYALTGQSITADDLVKRLSPLIWDFRLSNVEIARFLKEFHDSPHRSEQARSFVDEFCSHILLWFAAASLEDIPMRTDRRYNGSPRVVRNGATGFIQAASFVGCIIEHGLLSHELVRQHIVKPLINHHYTHDDINGTGKVARANAVYRLFIIAGKTLLQGLLEINDATACLAMLEEISRQHRTWIKDFDPAKLKEFHELHLEWIPQSKKEEGKDVAETEGHEGEEEATRHKTFYLEDGNVEIVCGHTIFRAHSPILSFSSSKLRDMFSPSTLLTAPMSEGCPRIVFKDSAQDFAVLLRMIYTPGFPARHKVPEFTTFASLLRMTTKYGFSDVREGLVEDLKRAYPTKREDPRTEKVLGEDIFGSPKPHPNAVLNLFLEQNIKFALPLATYRAALGGCRPSSGQTSVDLGTGGAPEPQRKKLQSLPRSKPFEEEHEVNGGSAGLSINKSGPVVMGPSSVWAGKKDAAKRDSTLNRVNSSSNMFMMLGRDAEATPETGSKPSRPSSRRTSVHLGGGGAPERQRKKLRLLPRSRPLEEERKINGGSADYSEDEGGDDAPPTMSEAEANKKIVEDIKELFSIRNIDESENYFAKLPSEHHHLLVDKMVSKAIESKEADGQLVADVFARVVEKKLCSASAFEEGFSPVAELLDDIAIDTPKVFQIMATMMKGARLDKDEKRRTRLAEKSMDSDKLLELLA